MKKKFIKVIAKYIPKNLKGNLIRSNMVITYDIPQGVYFKFANQRDEFDQAFKLLYMQYLSVNLQAPNELKMRITRYHMLPTSHTLVAKIGERVIGTLTIVKDSFLGLPSDNMLDLMKFKSQKVAEISALAIDKEYKGKIFFPLLKFMYEACVKLNIVNLIASTIPGIASDLYESVLFFDRITPKPIRYPFGNNLEVVFMHLNLVEAKYLFEKAYNKNSDKNNLFKYFTDYRIESFNFNYRDIKYSHEEFYYYFVDITKLLSEETEINRNAISQYYLKDQSRAS